MSLQHLVRTTHGLKLPPASWVIACLKSLFQPNHEGPEATEGSWPPSPGFLQLGQGPEPLSAPGTVNPCPKYPRAQPGPRAGAVPLLQKAESHVETLACFFWAVLESAVWFGLLVISCHCTLTDTVVLKKIRNKRISGHTLRTCHLQPVFGCKRGGKGSDFCQTRAELFFFLVKPLMIQKPWLRIRFRILVFCGAALGCKPHIWIPVTLEQTFNSSSSLLLILNFCKWYNLFVPGRTSAQNPVLPIKDRSLLISTEFLKTKP